MNGHRPLHSSSPSAVSSSNLFFFTHFRTLGPQRGTLNPFVINHFRTLSRATEGRGMLSALILDPEPLVYPELRGSPLFSFQRLTNCLKFATFSEPFCFQSLPIVNFCNSFVFKMLQQYPGVHTRLPVRDLSFTLSPYPGAPRLPKWRTQILRSSTTHQLVLSAAQVSQITSHSRRPGILYGKRRTVNSQLSWLPRVTNHRLARHHLGGSRVTFRAGILPLVSYG